ncbi:hypothetical protein Moror_16413 [Moniliophthora roreri MCA 2997]|uniref:Arrestin C-terminal-like domain-containing protein n=1 Tax=Moniliophthora roreri (strain MCA 2997) TaxID=1381753 RepID=V2XAZ7_MONRO|nr:hypothetical protein Moror_16413 [Moniliophthora roreri MCA 2997]
MSAADATSCFINKKSALSRHGTLFSNGASPARSAAELKVALGNAHARLKPGASLLQNESGLDSPTETTELERAKPRARVEVDLILDRLVCTQGGYLNGVVKIRIRRRAKDEGKIMVSGGKLRVLGFESIQNETHRHLFYQQSSSLAEVAPVSMDLFETTPDNGSFCQVKEGVHAFPFSMFLPVQGQFGNAKGVMPLNCGASVRYVVMFSIKVKERETGRRSIAHFYRDCIVWPRLNPSTCLSPSSKPIQATSSKSLFMGGSGKVTLVAALHRHEWVAGQQCAVKIKVINHTKKAIKSITLTLLRSTTIFKTDEDDPRYEPSAVQKQVAESTLEMGQRGARGHASARGWWTGVGTDETLEFSHLLLIPADALTIERSRLVEVKYTLRVGASAGPLASYLHVFLPLTIINFLSVDPPPTFPVLDRNFLNLDADEEDILYAPLTWPRRSRQSAAGHFEDMSVPSGIDQSVCPDYEEFDDEQPILGDLPLADDDDAFVHRALVHMAVDAKYAEHGQRFSDLYYASVQEGLAEIGRSALQSQAEALSIDTEDTTEDTPTVDTLTSPHSRESSHSSLHDHNISSMPRHSRKSTFAQRVQQKLEESKALGHANEEHTEIITAEKRPEVVTRQSSVTSAKLSIQRSCSGDSYAERMPRSTTGSYFRPRHEIPDEIERFEDVQEDLLEERTGSGLTASQTVPGLYQGNKEPQCSRIFGPRPPLKASRPPSDMSSGGESDDTYVTPLDSNSPVDESDSGAPPAVRIAQLEFGHSVAQFYHVPPASDSSLTTRRPGRARAQTLSALPNPRAGMAGLRAKSDYPMSDKGFGAGSVKDRIRQLEERSRAAERDLEANGPL